MTIRNLAAVDVGASSGRVMLASWQPDTQTLGIKKYTGSAMDSNRGRP